MNHARATAALAGLLALAAACRDRGVDARPAEPTLSGPGVQVVGETVKVRRGEAPPARSALFDGETVRLRGARGETLGVQVLLHRLGTREVSLSLEAPGVAVRPFEVGYLEVTEPSSNLYGPSAGPGAYPDILKPAPGPIHTGDAAYFDVEIAASAAPGVHRGALVVGEERFPVELRVEAARIDLERAPLVWVWFKAAELAGRHGMEDGDTPAQIALEARYAALFRRHGALLATDFPLERLRPREHFMTDDVRYWPVWIAKRDTAKMAADVAAWVEYFRDRPQIPYGFTIDEPSEEEREQVRAHGLAIRAAGGGDPRFLYAVTDEPRAMYRGGVDVFVSPRGIPRPAGYGPGVRFWTYNGREPGAGNMTIDKPGTALRTWGWIAQRYEIELWFAWEGLYYTDRYNEPAGPTDVMKQPLTYDERRKGKDEHGNGDGLLAYPGPLPSLRLKALRRGLADRLLLRSLAGCGPEGAAEATGIAGRLIPRALAEATGRRGAWPDDEPPWERARHEVLDAIARRCPAAPPAAAATAAAEEAP